MTKRFQRPSIASSNNILAREPIFFFRLFESGLQLTHLSLQAHMLRYRWREAGSLALVGNRLFGLRMGAFPALITGALVLLL